MMVMEKAVIRVKSKIKQTLKVPLKFHWSAIILPALLLYQFGLLGIPMVLILFVSLLVHEYSHVYMARVYDFPVEKVVVCGIGAAAFISDLDPTDYEQSRNIALAGPLSSFFLFLILLPIVFFYPNRWLIYLTAINLLMAVFNILPLFPSDGGRILYSTLGLKYGAFKALKISTMISWILCGAGALTGLIFGAYWISFVLIILILFAYQQKRATESILVSGGYKW